MPRYDDEIFDYLADAQGAGLIPNINTRNDGEEDYSHDDDE